MKRGIAIVIVSALLLGGLGLAAHPWPSRAASFITLSSSGWSDPAIGTWDSENMTGVLTTPPPKGTGIQIVSDGVALEGSGLTLTGSGSGAGVYLDGRTGVTVRNVKVEGFAFGIYLYNGSTGNTLSGNTVSHNTYGICLKGNSSDNILAGNTLTSNDDGFWLHSSPCNTLTDNVAEGNQRGVWLDNSNRTKLENNTVQGNDGLGLFLYNSTGSEVYYNSFLSNGSDGKQHANANEGGNKFYLDDPKGGNYWEGHTSPDADGDGIVDNEYTFNSSQVDEYPWVMPGGWNAPPPAPPTPEPTFITGGGWVKPAQASIPGKAHVEVECRYKKDAEAPTGKLKLKVGDLRFNSTAFDLLSIDNGQAWCHGQGTDGAGTYSFVLGVSDGPKKGHDKIRIKVWDESSGNVLYDSQPGADDGAAPEAELNGGSITIHKD